MTRRDGPRSFGSVAHVAVQATDPIRPSVHADRPAFLERGPPQRGGRGQDRPDGTEDRGGSGLESFQRFREPTVPLRVDRARQLLDVRRVRIPDFLNRPVVESEDAPNLFLEETQTPATELLDLVFRDLPQRSLRHLVRPDDVWRIDERRKRADRTVHSLQTDGP